MRPAIPHTRRRQHRLIAIVSIATLLGAFATVVQAPLTAEKASAATTTSLTTATTRSLLAKKIAVADFSTANEVVVAQDSDLAVQVGANMATRSGIPVLVAESGTSPAELLAQLTTWGATHVQLVSSTPDFFAAAYKTSLAAQGVTVNEIQGTTPFDLSRTGGFVAATEEYVLARWDNQLALRLAISYASTRGLPLITYEATTPDADLTSFFSSTAEASLTFFGPPETIPYDKMSEAQTDKVFAMPITDPEKAYTWLSGQAQVAGVDVNDVVVAPAGVNAELAIAGAHARTHNRLLAVAGVKTSLTYSSRANEYMTKWRNGIAGVELVGVGLTAANLTSVAAPSTLAQTAKPAFRILDIVKNASTYTLTYSTVAEATSYKVLDLDLATVATATTTTMTLPSEQRAFSLLAKKGNITLGRLEVRANDYEDASMRSSLIVGAVEDGTMRLSFLSPIQVPRLITRSMNDPLDASGVQSEEVPVAITCAAAWTDRDLDQTKQYSYRVSEMSNVTTHTCDASQTPQPADAASLVNSGITLPPTSLPAASSSSDQFRTKADQLIEQAVSGQSQRTTGIGVNATGDDWAPVILQWMAYIPEDKVPFPGTSLNPLKPRLAFRGDNHGTFQPNASARFKQTVTFTFGSSHDVTYAESMGVTHLLSCDPFYNDCESTFSKKAPLTELNFKKLSSTSTTGSAQVDAAATIPLVPLAPPIDTQWVVKLAPGKSVVYGVHDNMPKHELYIGQPNADFYLVYSSPYASWVQLPCLYNPHGQAVSKCGSKLNILL